MANLPPELIYEILLYLPVKSLLRFKSVSKSLSAIISNEIFINSRLKKSSEKRIHRNFVFLHNNNPSICNVRALGINNGGSMIPGEEFPLEIGPSQAICPFFLASCNGLILLRVGREELAVLNPFTREYKCLPMCPVGVKGKRVISLSFGYDSSKDDYKLLLIKQRKNVLRFKVWIFGFKLGLWRRIQNYPYVEHGVIIRGAKSCFVNGAFHFLSRGVQCRTRKIVAFNVAEENFSSVSLPDSMSTRFPRQLQVFEGCLCLIWCSYNLVDVEIYVRKKHGIDFTWSELCSFKNPRFVDFLMYGEILEYSNEGDIIDFWYGKHVCSYDFVTNDLRRIEIPNTYDNQVSTVSCIESLVPIKLSSEEEQ